MFLLEVGVDAFLNGYQCLSIQAWERIWRIIACGDVGKIGCVEGQNRAWIIGAMAGGNVCMMNIGGRRRDLYPCIGVDVHHGEGHDVKHGMNHDSLRRHFGYRLQ